MANQLTSGLMANQLTSGLMANQLTSGLMANQLTSGLMANQLTSDLVPNQRPGGKPADHVVLLYQTHSQAIRCLRGQQIGWDQENIP